MPVDNSIDVPPRITVIERGDDVIVRYAASALPGRIVCGPGIVALVAVPVFVFAQNGGPGALLAEDGGPIILGMSAFFSLIVIISLVMRGFNVTTFTLSKDRLTRRTVPFGLGRLAVPRDEIHRVATRRELVRKTSRDDGIRIQTYSVDVFDADNKRRILKGSVRGKTHSLYLALVIAETYDLPSIESFKERIEETRDLNPVLRLLVD